MEYQYTVTVAASRSFEFTLYLNQNYIMPMVDYTVITASSSTVEYRFKRLDHFTQFKSRWRL